MESSPNPQELIDEFIALNKREDWAVQAEKKGVTVSTLQDTSGITIMRGNEWIKKLENIINILLIAYIKYITLCDWSGVGTIKKTVSEVVAVIENPDLRGKWDVFYEDGQVLQPLTHTAEKDEVGLARMKFKGRASQIENPQNNEW